MTWQSAPIDLVSHTRRASAVSDDNPDFSLASHSPPSVMSSFPPSALSLSPPPPSSPPRHHSSLSTSSYSSKKQRPAKRQKRTTKKSCQSCIQSHLSCDRGRPCVNCARRGRSCAYFDDTPIPLTTDQSKILTDWAHLRPSNAADGPVLSSSSRLSPTPTPSSSLPLPSGSSSSSSSHCNEGPASSTSSPSSSSTETQVEVATRVLTAFQHALSSSSSSSTIMTTIPSTIPPHPETPLVLQQQASLISQLHELVQQQQRTIDQQSNFIRTMLAAQATILPFAAGVDPAALQAASDMFSLSPPSSPRSHSSPPCRMRPDSWNKDDLAAAILNLMCASREEWQRAPDTAAQTVLGMHRTLIRTHPKRLLLSIHMNFDKKPSLNMASPAYLEIAGTTHAGLKEMLLNGKPPMMSPERSLRINAIIPTVYLNFTGCHKVMYEESSHFMLEGEQRSGEFFTGIFYDNCDRATCVISLVNLHKKLQPKTKPIIVTDYCPRCSKKTLPGLESRSLDQLAPSRPQPCASCHPGTCACIQIPSFVARPDPTAAYFADQEPVQVADVVWKMGHSPDALSQMIQHASDNDGADYLFPSSPW